MKSTLNKFQIILITLLSLVFSCQDDKSAHTHTRTLTVFEKMYADFPEIDKEPEHQVMTLGVFHFDRSMDGSDVVAKNHIDILSKQNQTELDSLLRLLKKFKPTRIAIEWRPNSQSYIDSLFSAYNSGRFELSKHETFQIGFRLAAQLNLDKLHCIDNNPPMPESVNSIEDFDAYAEGLGHTDLWHAYDDYNDAYLTFMDTLQNNLNVFDYLSLINSPKNMKRTKQLWTTGLINVGYGDTYVGADFLGRWYKRNSRIYSHAKNLVKEPEERLLIIYGGAHKWLLDELFESSPEFDVVQLRELQY